METHSIFGRIGKSTFFIDGIPDTCEHDYSDDVFISARGKIIHWHTYRQWARFTSEMRNRLTQEYHQEIDDPITIGTFECRKCHKIFSPPLF